MSRKPYKTEGRERLVRFLSQNPDRHFTADDLCRAILGNALSGRSSLYRQLSELCEGGQVKRFLSKDGQRNVYQYVGDACDCHRHFHAKCLQCGRIEHLACSDSGLFARHLSDEHGFLIDCAQSVLYGICAECREEGRA